MSGWEKLQEIMLQLLPPIHDAPPPMVKTPEHSSLGLVRQPTVTRSQQNISSLIDAANEMIPTATCAIALIIPESERPLPALIFDVYSDCRTLLTTTCEHTETCRVHGIISMPQCTKQCETLTAYVRLHIHRSVLRSV